MLFSSLIATYNFPQFSKISPPPEVNIAGRLSYSIDYLSLEHQYYVKKLKGQRLLESKRVAYVIKISHLHVYIHRHYLSGLLWGIIR